MPDTIRFSISLPKDLLKELDSKSVRKGYASRSEYVRDLVREKTIQEKWQAGEGPVIGVLTIIYDHHQPNLLYKIAEAQHNKHLNILCNTHVHIDHHNCLETIFIKGRPGDIENFKTLIGGIKGVKFSELTRASGFD